jgi:hypothetical protein
MSIVPHRQVPLTVYPLDPNLQSIHHGVLACLIDSLIGEITAGTIGLMNYIRMTVDRTLRTQTVLVSIDARRRAADQRRRRIAIAEGIPHGIVIGAVTECVRARRGPTNAKLGVAVLPHERTGLVELHHRQRLGLG